MRVMHVYVYIYTFAWAVKLRYTMCIKKRTVATARVAKSLESI